MKLKKIKIGKITYYIIIFAAGYLISFFLLESFLLALAFSILVLIGYLYILKDYKKDQVKYHKISASYDFVNLLNVQMLSTDNVYEAYQGIEHYLDVDFSSISNDDMVSILTTLSDDYQLNSFKMYVNTLILYINEGGNFKELQKIPTSLCQKCKLYYEGMKKDKKGKLFEVSTLYGLFILVMAFIKISITEYYEAMLTDLMYQFIFFAILAVGFMFYFLTVKMYFRNEIKGL